MLSTFLIGFAASESGGRFSVTAEQLDADPRVVRRTADRRDRATGRAAGRTAG
jgi:hypothetical protein